MCASSSQSFYLLLYTCHTVKGKFAFNAPSKKGWGAKRIAKEFGISKNTIKHYLKQGGWLPYKKRNTSQSLTGLNDWIESQFFVHRGNAEVLRQELVAQKNIKVSLRTVERAVQPLRQRLEAERKATVRFETRPGQQLQIDFGERGVEIAGEKLKLYFFVATLGYSRRNYVKVFLHERQSAWFEGMEGCFHHFGGIPEEILFDNPRSLVTKHNVETREIEFNPRLQAFAKYLQFKPKACAPYRARTKGKDERGVGYVKNNCIAGRSFVSLAALEEHIHWWMREIADKRVHGTTGEEPIKRFIEEENVLHPLMGRPPFLQIKEMNRIVHSDACVEVDTNYYSVP